MPQLGERPVYEDVRKKRGERGDIYAQDYSDERGERRPSGRGPQKRSHMKRPIHEMTCTKARAQVASFLTASSTALSNGQILA